MLEKERKQIDTIDKKIILLLKERQDIVEKIKLYKSNNSISILDQKREKNIEEKITLRSKELNLRESYIKNIFELIVKESHYIQNKK